METVKIPAAFTLVELLIVVTIISIIGVASISGFSRLSETQDAETNMKVIARALDSFDKEVVNHEIVSYETVFESGSLGFVANLDSYKKTTPLQYSFDFDTGTGMIRSTGNGTGMVEIYFDTYDALGVSSMLSMSGGSQPIVFPARIQKRRYQITSELDGMNLNSYIMQYYNLTNVDNIQEKEVRLVKIEGSIGGITNQYNSLIVRNTLGKKFLEGSGTTLDVIEKATLHFQKNGKEWQMNMVP